MKSIEDIIAVLLSGSILIFSFFYVVNNHLHAITLN